jgi:predicted PurR-regulated permease PerM
LFARPLALVVLAFAIAQALSPLANYLQRYMPRTAGVVLVYAALAGLLVALLASVVPTLVYEARQLLGDTPELIRSAQRWVARWLPFGDRVSADTLASAIKQWDETLLQLPLQGLSLIFDVLVVLFLSLYLLMAGPQLKRFVLSLVPRRTRARPARVLQRMGRSMGGYIRGVAISGAFVGGLTWFALLLVGLEYRRSLAAAAAFGEFVPYIGPLLAAIPAVLVALAQSPPTALVVALIYLGMQQLESYVITPNVMRTQTDLHPALVLIALVAGLSIGGILGALAALPLFAAARVLLLAAAPAIRRELRRHHDTRGHTGDGRTRRRDVHGRDRVEVRKCAR